MQQPRITTSDMSVTVARLPDPRLERPAERPHSSSFSSTASASHHTSPSPVSSSNRSSSNSSSHSPMTLPPPQSPLQMSKTLPSNSAGIAGKPSPLLTPQADRRPSLISLGPSSLGPSSPSMPASPAGSRFSVPTVRDLRSSSYLNAICGMHKGLTHAVRAAVQGHTTVDADGRVQIVPVTPPVPVSPATASPPASAAAAVAPVKQPASTIAPASGSLRRRNSTSETSVSSTHSSTPSTPRREIPPSGAAAAAGQPAHPLSASADPHAHGAHGELQISRHMAFHQLLLNLLTYLPPLPSALLAGGPNGELKRVFVGLSVGTSAGKPWFEEKIVWPVSSLPPATATGSSSSSHSTSHSQGPTSPAGSAGHSKTPSVGAINAGTTTSPNAATVAAGTGAGAGAVGGLPPLPGAAGAGELLHGASGAAAVGSCTPPLSSRTSLSRRPSMGSDEAGGIGFGWNDGDIVLSVFLLLDPIDIDSKQITFVAHSRSIDTNALFQMLYKLDCTAPNEKTYDKPLPLYAQVHAQMTLPPTMFSATAASNSPTATATGRSAVQHQQQSQQQSAGVSKSLAALAFAPAATATAATSPTKPSAAQ